MSIITSVIQSPSIDAHTPAHASSADPKTPATGGPVDTVAISNNARIALQQSVQEATETHDQTVKEAARGDRQAQRLLAKEDATTRKA